LTGARDEERKKSLAALRRIAEESQRMPWLPKAPPKPRREPPRMGAAPPPEPRRPRAAPPAAPPPARPKLDPRFEGKRAKQEEERRLRALRERDLQRGAQATWRGMPWGDVPASIRRTPFDRAEPAVQQKILDILGEAKEKEGRAKHRAKGRRQGGR
jgi:hypothetical protein